jgi:glycosyltransferase involved in cell wall biosynthesis
MKVAYFSPLPPSTSGIADYSALLLPALERLVEVQVVRPGRTRPIADADVALYHVGNNPDDHAWIVDALRRRPGIVVLHDFVIHHLVAGMTIGRNDGHAYLAAMEREAGVAGRMLGWGVLEGRVPPLWEVRPAEFPLAGEVLDRATGLIVHSRYVEARAREHGYEGPLWRIPHPAWHVPDVKAAPIAGSPLFGCFGHLNENKRIPQLLRAFARLRERRPDARLLLVGAEAPGFDLAGRLERLGLDDEGVVREPYVEEERLWSLLAACDACVLLRSPTMGETSGSAIRTLALGKPLVVNDLGWFSELPGDVAIKVPAGGGDEVDAIAAALERLAEPGVADRMGEAARTLVRTEHDLDRVAERYVEVLEQTAGAGTVQAAIGTAVAAAALDAGLPAETLAPELAELGLLGANGRVPEPESRLRLLGSLPNWAWLGALYVAAVVVEYALARRVVSPWIMVDELVYSDIARSFADTGHFLIRGLAANYGPVYPLLVAPAYLAFDGMANVYRAVHVVNAVTISTVVFPVYLLARRVVRPGYALACAALAVAVPSTVYAGTIMTENAFYPIFAWLALALVLALEEPTWRRQIVLLAVCVLAFLTRAQAVALVGAALTAPLLLAWIERGRPRRLSAWKPLYGLVGAGALGILAVQLARGKSPSDILGGYSVTTATSTYHVVPALRWIVYHVAGLDLALGVIPFAALVVVVASARHLDAPLRAFAAAAAALAVWLTVEVGIFASAWSQRIEERNLFHLAPLFIVALFAWLERGQPRPPRAVVVAGAFAAAIAGVLPLVSLLNISAVSDTQFVQPWWYVAQRVASPESAQVLLVVTAMLLAAAFLWLPARYAPALPVLVAVMFLLTWVPLQLWIYSFPRFSALAYTNGIGAGTSWIDAAVGRDADVTIVWTSNDNPYRGWENEFWNRSVRRAYGVGGANLLTSAFEPQLTLDPSTGRLLDPAGRPVQVRYVLADQSARIVGTRVAADTSRALVLYRVDGTLRTSGLVTGWSTDHWIGSRAVWSQSRCTGGSLHVPVHSDAGLFAGTTQRIRITGTTPSQTVSLDPGGSKTIVAALRPVGGSCFVRIAVAPTRRPVDVPALHSQDARPLGVMVDSFDYEPS